MATRKVSDTVKQEVWQKSGGVCHWCGKPMVYRMCKAGNKQHPNDFTVDHLVPFAAGGKTTVSNLVGAHLSCNQERGVVFDKMCTKNYKLVPSSVVERWGLTDAKTTMFSRGMREANDQLEATRISLRNAKPDNKRYQASYNKPVGWLTRVARWAGAI